MKRTLFGTVALAGNRTLFGTAALAGACLLGLSGCGSSDLADTMDAGAFSKVYDISGNYKNLDLKTNIADITIQTGDTPSLEVHMDKWYKMEDVTESDTLYLTEKNDGPFWQKWLHFGLVHNSLILTLPENYVEQLIVSTDVGDVNISGLVAAQLSLEADTGDVKIEDVIISSIKAELDTGDLMVTDVASDEIDLENDTGQIKLEDSVTGILQAETDTGDVKISGLTVDTVQVASDTGDILIQLSDGTDINLADSTGDIGLTVSGSQNEYNYNITNDVGDLNIGDSRMEGIGTIYNVSNGTDKNITISNDTGDIRVSFEQ